MNKTVISILFILCFAGHSIAQSEGLPRTYPLEMETLLYHGTYVKITYTKSPAKSDRPEEGSLWQLGSNEPAELMSTGDLIIGIDTLKAGAYSIFAIPQDSTWTIIFNGDVGMFGTYRYNENADSLRVEGLVSKANKYSDELKIVFTRKGVPDSEISIYWKESRINIPVRILEPEEND